MANSTYNTTAYDADRSPPAVVASLAHGRPDIAGALNVCFIFALISASNSSLYIGSRVLYGLVTSWKPSMQPFKWICDRLSYVNKRQAVPWGAVIFSWFSFFWLPFLSLVHNDSALSSLVEIIAVSASVCCMLTWASLCGAFIRYLWHLKTYWKAITEHDDLWPLAQRDERGYTASTLFHGLQPGLAWIGFLGAILIIVATSATWWTQKASVTSAIAAFGAPVVLLGLWVILKIFRWRRPRKRNRDRVDDQIRDERGFINILTTLYLWRRRKDMQERSGPPGPGQLARNLWTTLAPRRRTPSGNGIASQPMPRSLGRISEAPLGAPEAPDPNATGRIGDDAELQQNETK